MTENKTDTEWVECNAGVGTWLICRNPICYRCGIVDQAEMESYPPAEKGPTIEHIGNMRTEATWMEIGVEQRIGKIGKFLMNNKRENELADIGRDHIECGRGKG
eukprot:2874282-Heterocapsa_arctica.AAC.1